MNIAARRPAARAFVLAASPLVAVLGGIVAVDLQILTVVRAATSDPALAIVAGEPLLLWRLRTPPRMDARIVLANGTVTRVIGSAGDRIYWRAGILRRDRLIVPSWRIADLSWRSSPDRPCPDPRQRRLCRTERFREMTPEGATYVVTGASSGAGSMRVPTGHMLTLPDTRVGIRPTLVPTEAIAGTFAATLA